MHTCMEAPPLPCCLCSDSTTYNRNKKNNRVYQYVEEPKKTENMMKQMSK